MTTEHLAHLASLASVAMEGQQVPSPSAVLGKGQVDKDIDRAKGLVLEHDVFDERKRQPPTLYSDGITLHGFPSRGAALGTNFERRFFA